MYGEYGDDATAYILGGLLEGVKLPETGVLPNAGVPSPLPPPGFSTTHPLPCRITRPSEDLREWIWAPLNLERRLPGRTPVASAAIVPCVWSAPDTTSTARFVIRMA